MVEFINKEADIALNDFKKHLIEHLIINSDNGMRVWF